MPAIELVDSRLVETRAAPAPARLADLQSHGALACGAPAAMTPGEVDLRALRTRLWFDGQIAAALMANAATLLSSPPNIEKVELLAVKLPA